MAIFQLLSGLQMADFQRMTINSFACERGTQNVDEILVTAVNTNDQSRIRIRQERRGPLRHFGEVVEVGSLDLVLARALLRRGGCEQS